MTIGRWRRRAGRWICSNVACHWIRATRRRCSCSINCVSNPMIPMIPKWPESQTSFQPIRTLLHRPVIGSVPIASASNDGTKRPVTEPSSGRYRPTNYIPLSISVSIYLSILNSFFFQIFFFFFFFFFIVIVFYLLKFFFFHWIFIL